MTNEVMRERIEKAAEAMGKRLGLSMDEVFEQMYYDIGINYSISYGHLISLEESNEILDYLTDY